MQGIFYEYTNMNQKYGAYMGQIAKVGAPVLLPFFAIKW